MFEYAGVLDTTAEGEEGSELQLLASWLTVEFPLQPMT